MDFLEGISELLGVPEHPNPSTPIISSDTAIKHHSQSISQPISVIKNGLGRQSNTTRGIDSSLTQRRAQNSELAFHSVSTIQLRGPQPPKTIQRPQSAHDLFDNGDSFQFVKPFSEPLPTLPLNQLPPLKNLRKPRHPKRKNGSKPSNGGDSVDESPFSKFGPFAAQIDPSRLAAEQLVNRQSVPPPSFVAPIFQLKSFDHEYGSTAIPSPVPSPASPARNQPVEPPVLRTSYFGTEPPRVKDTLKGTYNSPAVTRGIIAAAAIRGRSSSHLSQDSVSTSPRSRSNSSHNGNTNTDSNTQLDASKELSIRKGSVHSQGDRNVNVAPLRSPAIDEESELSSSDSEYSTTSDYLTKAEDAEDSESFEAMGDEPRSLVTLASLPGNTDWLNLSSDSSSDDDSLGSSDSDSDNDYVGNDNVEKSTSLSTSEIRRTSSQALNSSNRKISIEDSVTARSKQHVALSMGSTNANSQTPPKPHKALSMYIRDNNLDTKLGIDIDLSPITPTCFDSSSYSDSSDSEDSDENDEDSRSPVDNKKFDNPSNSNSSSEESETERSNQVDRHSVSYSMSSSSANDSDVSSSPASSDEEEGTVSLEPSTFEDNQISRVSDAGMLASSPPASATHAKKAMTSTQLTTPISSSTALLTTPKFLNQTNVASSPPTSGFSSTPNDTNGRFLRLAQPHVFPTSNNSSPENARVKLDLHDENNAQNVPLSLSDLAATELNHSTEGMDTNSNSRKSTGKTKGGREENSSTGPHDEAGSRSVPEFIQLPNGKVQCPFPNCKKEYVRREMARKHYLAIHLGEMAKTTATTNTKTTQASCEGDKDLLQISPVTNDVKPQQETHTDSSAPVASKSDHNKEKLSSSKLKDEVTEKFEKSPSETLLNFNSSGKETTNKTVDLDAAIAKTLASALENLKRNRLAAKCVPLNPLEKDGGSKAKEDYKSLNSLGKSPVAGVVNTSTSAILHDKSLVVSSKSETKIPKKSKKRDQIVSEMDSKQRNSTLQPSSLSREIERAAEGPMSTLLQPPSSYDSGGLTLEDLYVASPKSGCETQSTNSTIPSPNSSHLSDSFQLSKRAKKRLKRSLGALQSNGNSIAGTPSSNGTQSRDELCSSAVSLISLSDSTLSLSRKQRRKMKKKLTKSQDLHLSGLNHSVDPTQIASSNIEPTVNCPPLAQIDVTPTKRNLDDMESNGKLSTSAKKRKRRKQALSRGPYTMASSLTNDDQKAFNELSKLVQSGTATVEQYALFQALTKRITGA